MTIRELSKAFLAHGLHGCAATTRLTYEKYLPPFLRRFGSRKPSELTPLDMLKFLKTRKTWKSQSTFATFDRCVRNLFNWSIRMGLTDTNPMSRIQAPAFTRRRNWTAAEFNKVIHNCEPDLRRLLYLLAWTGCRPAECRTLRFEHIDWSRHCIVLHQHKTRTVLRKSRPRIIVLVPKAERLLRWMYDRRSSDYVFVTCLRQEPFKSPNLCNRFRRLCERLGLPEDLKLYGARHMWATNAIRNGVKLKTLSELLGHSTVQHTEKYIHLNGDVSHLLKVTAQATGYKLTNNGKDSK